MIKLPSTHCDLKSHDKIMVDTINNLVNLPTLHNGHAGSKSDTAKTKFVFSDDIAHHSIALTDSDRGESFDVDAKQLGGSVGADGGVLLVKFIKDTSSMDACIVSGKGDPQLTVGKHRSKDDSRRSMPDDKGKVILAGLGKSTSSFDDL